MPETLHIPDAPFLNSALITEQSHISHEDNSEIFIVSALSRQRIFFNQGYTKSLKFRREQLLNFKVAVKKYEKRIADALRTDLNKSYEEAYLTEISIVTQEIDHHLNHLRRWMKPRRVPTPVALLPSSSRIYFEPLGVALIMAPWNYPFQLLMNPLVGAISSGCCAMLKPSPYTPTIAKVMEELIIETFDPGYVTIFRGGRKVNELLLKQRFDFIFYTGSPMVGKVVMRAAAEHLTPVVLELGGKSPCIVDADANLEIAARRIAWGKTINAGQTCIAPDYLLVQQSIKDELIKKIGACIDEMYGPDISQSKWFPRIVNDQALERLQKLMKHGKVVYGGQVDPGKRYIEPTLIDEVKPDYPIMQEEIFGPILPVLTFDKIDQAISYVNSQEKSLALYFFGNSKIAREILATTSSGGGCINDTLLHIANRNLPFGGVGSSGMGKYHSRTSFLAFSNQRSIVSSPVWIDLPFKYVPFKGFKWIKKIL
jgi:aldehyde dehydrogenase (NAD+)